MALFGAITIFDGIGNGISCWISLEMLTMPLALRESRCFDFARWLTGAFHANYHHDAAASHNMFRRVVVIAGRRGMLYFIAVIFHLLISGRRQMARLTLHAIYFG